MIEQQLEQKIIDKFENALSGMNIQIVGVWQPMSDDQLKGIEDGSSDGILTIKMPPRSYETPTIPTAQFPCVVSLGMRADVDADGQKYLAVTEILTDILQRWQNNLDDVISDLQIEDTLDVAGFQLTGGDVGADRTNKVWTYTQNFIVYAVVIK